jgi:hypothetical protein
MENTNKPDPVLDTIAWGAFFILWGITEMFQSLPDGLGALGVGIILLGLNLVRSRQGQPTSGFTITLGVMALLMGALELAEPYLHLSIEIPVFPILLIMFGVSLLGSASKGSKNHG